MTELLTRDEFREGVFARDGGKCVVCSDPAKDAHHIIERRLFPDGGYYLDNGASVCEKDHLRAEMTVLDCVTLRELIGTTQTILPPHLYTDAEYTKWGDIINADGTRTPGELFEDESVQKVLGMGNVLHLYTKYRKYPRTYHLPWSPTVGKDDRVLPESGCFNGKQVVVTEKMDGENTTIYWDGYCHARSLDSGYHPSRERTKALAAAIGWQLPHGWRICGENLTAIHSITYNDLPSFFLAFSIWNEKNECLSWEDSLVWFDLLNLMHAPVMYEGPWTTNSFGFKDDAEGYVVRNADRFHYRDFRFNVAKYVQLRIGPEVHNWMHQEVRYQPFVK